MPVIVADLKRRKKALKLTTEQVAYMAELPVSTVSKIMTGETKNPSYVTVEKIDEVLAKEERMARAEAYKEAIREKLESHPEETMYLKHEEYENMTVDELSDFGEDRYVELLNGKLIISERPWMNHVRLVEKIGYDVDSFIEKNDAEGEAFSTGLNVFLGERKDTLLIPDVLVVLDDSKIVERGIVGAPDWVVEVTTEGTRHRDYNSKMHKYMECGVREYWVDDSEKEKVSVFINGEPMMVHVYTFDDHIPVGIYDGKLEICINDDELLRT